MDLLAAIIGTLLIGLLYLIIKSCHRIRGFEYNDGRIFFRVYNFDSYAFRLYSFRIKKEKNKKLK